MSAQGLTDNLDSRVSYTILTQINSLNKEILWGIETAACTYTKLLLQSDTLSKGCHYFIREVGIAAEIERLELLKLAELPENRTNTGDIHDGVVLKGHLNKILPIFQICKDCPSLVLVNDTVLSDITESAYSLYKIL